MRLTKVRPPALSPYERWAADHAVALEEAAAETETEPTEAQKEQGNYKKGRFQWNGLTLVIETPKGATRSGKSKDGTEWSIDLKDHYGYVAGAESGADSDAVDVFVSEDDPDSELVFVINQLKAGGGFDEHKCVIGCTTEEAAREAYLRNYAPGWKGLGSVKAMTLEDFKTWVKSKPSKAAAFNSGIEYVPVMVMVKRADSMQCYECPECGGDLYGGIPGTETRFRGSGRCVDCGHGIALIAAKRAGRIKMKDKRASDDDAPFTVAVDLDGTLAEKEEPFSAETIGPPRTETVEWVRKFKDAGARIIIFTVRGSDDLVAGWLDENDVPYDYINENPDQPEDSSGKVIADVYWDDRAFNAVDPDEHGPDILRKITEEDHDPRNDTTGPTVTITRHTVITITGPELLTAMEDSGDPDAGEDRD